MELDIQAPHGPLEILEEEKRLEVEFILETKVVLSLIYEPQPPRQHQHQPSQPHEIQTPCAGPDAYYWNRTVGFRPSMSGLKQVYIYINLY